MITPIKNVNELPVKLAGKGSGLSLRTPFQIGNKKARGRPPTAKCIPEILRRIGNEPLSRIMLARLRAKWGPGFAPKNNHEAVLMVAMAQAQEGDAMARSFIADRTEGKIDSDATKALFNFGNINNGDNVQVNLTALIQKRAHEYIEAVRELGKKEGVPGLDGRDESVHSSQALPVTRTISRS